MEIVDCNTAQLVLYQVKQGDTLNSIAKIFKVDNMAIVRNNGNLELYQGEIVKIVKNKRKYHIVKPMETLTSISQMYNKSEESIVKINNLKSKRLFVGQMLVIFD